jgi:RNA polymerase sigma-70 factor (ECF subfamily)
MTQTSEQSLVQRSLSGDLDAFGELVRIHQTAVFNVCLRLMGSAAEAEDLAQEAFVRAFRKLNTFDSERPFGPWIRRVAANLCINNLRRVRPTTLSLEEDHDLAIDGTEADPEARRMLRERDETLREAILGLPPRDRAVIELRHFQSMSYSEIADELGISVGDVKSHLYRARHRLAERLRDDR